MDAGRAAEAGQSVSGERNADWLFRSILRAADKAGMPDTYWQTDRQIIAARDALGVPADGRYTHAHLWAEDSEPEKKASQ